MIFTEPLLKTNEKSTFLSPRGDPKRPKIVPRRPQDGLISILCSLRFSHRFLITFCLDFGGIWGGLREPRSVIFGIDFHMSCQDRPKSGQERPKSRPRGQKGTQKAAKRHPRASKKTPKQRNKRYTKDKQKTTKRHRTHSLQSAMALLWRTQPSLSVFSCSGFWHAGRPFSLFFRFFFLMFFDYLNYLLEHLPT